MTTKHTPGPWGGLTYTTTPTPDIINVCDSNQKEIIKIDPEGRVFWLGREVESDADFRGAMLDLAAALRGDAK
jgi:hypothetical protein